MTTSAMRRAWLFGLVIVFFLPKQVVRHDDHSIGGKTWCHTVVVEPLAFYGLESVTGREIGFAYSRDDECR